jgi:hypothetical protein
MFKLGVTHPLSKMFLLLLKISLMIYFLFLSCAGIKA